MIDEKPSVGFWLLNHGATYQDALDHTLEDGEYDEYVGLENIVAFIPSRVLENSLEQENVSEEAVAVITNELRNEVNSNVKIPIEYSNLEYTYYSDRSL